MFVRFRTVYGPRRDDRAPGHPWLVDQLQAAEGYIEFAEEFAGLSFGCGLYRVHDATSGPGALAAIRDAFPEFGDRVCPFGYDWLGSQFAVDAGRVAGGQPQVLMLEPGTGEALEIPVSFAAFHDEELIDFADAALAPEFFDSWAREHPDAVPLDRADCVGYRVPLFLGGRDVVDNLEVSDIEVYWALCGQLRGGTRELPPGMAIDDVTGG